MKTVAYIFLFAPLVVFAVVDNPYGACAHITRAEFPPARTCDMMRQVGMGWVRCDFDWHQLETKKGMWDFDRFDGILAECEAKGIDLFAGRAAAFTGNVTLPANAVLEITDAENLFNYSGVRSVVVLSTTGTWATISGTPNLVLKNSDGALYPEGDRCSLSLDSDGMTLRLRVKADLKIVIR